MDYGLFEDSLGSWGPKMKQFIEGPQCDEIYSYLKKRSSEGRTILPSWEDTFNAFQKTPFEDLKVIIAAQDPYPWQKNGKNVSDGIAMSCSNTGIEQPSLSLFLDGIADVMPEYAGVDRDPDLSYLCSQGVMMLNTSLTVELNRPNSHSQVRVLDKKIRLWEPFFKYFFEEIITSYCKGLVVVFCGKESAYYERFINPLQHYIFKVEHPSAAAHSERSWKHENVFKKINTILKENNNTRIDWIKKR